MFEYPGDGAEVAPNETPADALRDSPVACVASSFKPRHAPTDSCDDQNDQNGQNDQNAADALRRSLLAARDPSLSLEPEFAHVPLDTLEEELGALAGHLNAGTYRMLVLIAEFERREPWGQMGCLSGAHYLNWKCGIALGAAREKVRSACALRILPQIRAAFREGRISYSKVRALTRVATPDNEAALLQIALGGTATHVERVVRHYRSIEAAAEPAGIYHRRELVHWWDDDGSLVIKARLTPEQGAAFVKALEFATDIHDPTDDDDSRSANRADALTTISEGYLARAGVGSSAAEGLGVGAGSRTADRFQVRVSIPVSTLMALPAEIGLRTHAASTPRAAPNSTPESVPVLDTGPPLSLATAHRLCCDGSVIPIIEDADGNPLHVGARTRTVPSSLRRALERRDGGCRFPGCTNTKYVDAHHIVHWAHGGPTTLANLVLLCRKHHTWLHEGGYRIAPPQTESVLPARFLDPRGWLIEPASPHARSRGNVRSLIDANEARDIRITPKTAQCTWDGRRPDFDHIMLVLFQHKRYVPRPRCGR